MAAAFPEGPGMRIETTASNLLLEAVAGEVVEALRRVGMRSVLIRGATTERWLYEDDPRAYGDVDLLVDPARFDHGERVLEEVGFEPSRMERLFEKGRPSHASTWARESVMVDLHRTLVGLGVSAEEAWAVLSENTEAWEVGRAKVEVLAPAGRCVVLALHMAQHGPEFARTREDLERAIARAPRSAWFAAVDLARRLRAETSMAAGLLSVQGGRQLCETLGLHLEDAVASEGSASFHAAQGLAWLIESRGVRAKAHYIRIKLFPPSSVMRSRARWARSGRLALALAYAVRLARIAWHAPRAALTVAQLRRERRR
jgi:hypothetical protein